MKPDFKASTIDTLAKRAGYRCSNQDCRVQTVGPNSKADKATLIGEAAHIYGARKESPRYNADMDDAKRAEITNGIWLCRNCHGKVDRDVTTYPAELLFIWREKHEKYVSLELGNSSDRIRFELLETELSELSIYPAAIRRIAIDKPELWEYRFTIELLRHLNKPLQTRLDDLRRGLYTRSREHLNDTEVAPWINERLDEMGHLVRPFEGLLGCLSDSWSKPGIEGYLNEIHHSCTLIRDALSSVIDHEERLQFVSTSEAGEPVIRLLQDVLGSQADKVFGIPDTLERGLQRYTDGKMEMNEEGMHVMHEIISFETPKGWHTKFNRALRKFERQVEFKENPGATISSYFWTFFFIFILALIIL